MGHEARWQIVKLLGEGGQGKVFLVRDKQFYGGKDFPHGLVNGISVFSGGSHLPKVRETACTELRDGILSIVAAEAPENMGALKQLHEPEDSRDADRARERIGREIDAMSRVNHPSLLRILDASPEERWFVSEYHAGGPLSASLLKFKGDVKSALSAFRPMVEGVACLHDNKIIHRDVKPANVFVASDDRLVLGDFGLVYFVDEKHTRLSGTLENVGSRDWMAPWAMGVRIEDLRPTFDVFALGKLLWAMISGKQFLRLWYWDRDDFRIEKIIPNLQYIELVNGIFERTIVEEEENCLHDARSLLNLVDEVSSAVDARPSLVGGQFVRSCQVCGMGEYRLIVDRNQGSLRNFGLQPAGLQSMKVFSCSNCGHVQLFYTEDGADPPAWSGAAVSRRKSSPTQPSSEWRRKGRN